MSGYQQLGYGSAVVNGHLVADLMGGQVYPSNAYVPYYAGRFAPTPTLPGVVGGNPGGNVAMSASDAAMDPFNPVKSPVLWAVAFLIIGVVGLRYIHFRPVES